MDIGQTKLTKDSTNITCIIYGPNENINKQKLSFHSLNHNSYKLNLHTFQKFHLFNDCE